MSKKKSKKDGRSAIEDPAVRFINPLEELGGEELGGAGSSEDGAAFEDEQRASATDRAVDRDDPDSPTATVEAEVDPTLFEEEDRIVNQGRATLSYMFFWIACLLLIPIQGFMSSFMFYVAILVRNSLTTLGFVVCASIPAVLLVGLRGARRRSESWLQMYAFLTVLVITMQLSVAIVIVLDTDAKLLTAFLGSVAGAANQLCALPVDKLPIGFTRADGSMLEQVCSCFEGAAGTGTGIDMVGCLTEVADERFAIKTKHIVASKSCAAVAVWVRSLRSTVCTRRFARFCAFSVAILPGSSVLRNLDGGIYPKFMLRTFGPTVPKGTIYALEPALDLILVPLFTKLTAARSHFVVIRVGLCIAAISPLVIYMLGATIPTVVGFVLVLTLGDALYTARTGAKRHFLRHLCIKCIILPRQARDKHRESTQTKEWRFA
eukprot:COSAG06_NODE_4066_length_4609_cov_4.807761_3_plen_434_part_00